jgi:O-antigen/teichoic acid export membrane protein
LSDVGLFTWASQVASLPALLLLGVQAALTPLIMKHHAEPETPKVIARTLEAIIAAELCFCLGVGLFTPDLIHWLGYSAYAGAGPLVMVLAPALLLLQLNVFAPGFAVGERTDLQLIVSMLGAVAALVCNYIFISFFGLIGAALATLVSSAVFLAAWFIMSHRLYPTPVRWGRLLLFALFAIAAGGVGATIGGYSLVDLAIKFGLTAVLGILALAFGLVRLAPSVGLIMPRTISREVAK